MKIYKSVWGNNYKQFILSMEQDYYSVLLFTDKRSETEYKWYLYGAVKDLQLDFVIYEN